MGGGLSAYSAVAEGREIQAAANSNAAIEEDNATFAKQAGEDRAQQIIRLGDEARATTRNRASVSGLVADTGSPLLIQEEAIFNAAKDANKTRYAASVQAYGNRQRARQFRTAGRNAYAGGQIRGSMHLLDMATNAFKGIGMGASSSGGGAGGGSGVTGSGVAG